MRRKAISDAAPFFFFDSDLSPAHQDLSSPDSAEPARPIDGSKYRLTSSSTEAEDASTSLMTLKSGSEMTDSRCPWCEDDMKEPLRIDLNTTQSERLPCLLLIRNSQSEHLQPGGYASVAWCCGGRRMHAGQVFSDAALCVAAAAFVAKDLAAELGEQAASTVGRLLQFVVLGLDETRDTGLVVRDFPDPVALAGRDDNLPIIEAPSQRYCISCGSSCREPRD